MNTRNKVLFCNLLIIILCIMSIAAYFFMPFWQVKAEYTLSAETLKNMLPTTENQGEDNPDAPVDADDLLSNIDFTEILGENGITLTMSISLETKDILSSLSAEPTELVETILEGNVHNLVNQISAPMSMVVKSTVKVVVKTALTEGIKEEVKKKLGENTTDEQLTEELKNAGLDEEFIDQKTSELVDTIYEPGTTSESAADATVDIAMEFAQKMKDSGNPDYADLELTEETKADLKEELLEQFKNFENEDGSIDPDAFTTDFLLKMLKGETSDDESTETAAVLATPLSAKPITDGSSQNDANAELRQVLTDKLMELLGGAEDDIAMAIKILSYVILATFAIWALPILKILLKMKSRNNAIKVGMPIWFGSIPYVVLCLLPTLALTLLQNPPAQLAGTIGEIGALSGLSITFTSCAMVSFIAGIVLAVLVLFFYGKQRRILKRYGGYMQTRGPAPQPQPQRQPEQTSKPSSDAKEE